MGKAPKLPPQPDPKALAKDEARLNRLDVYSPDSNIRYGFTNAGGQFSPGVAPDDRQAAVQAKDTGQQSVLRGIMEPASTDFTKQILADNASPPGPAIAGERGQFGKQIFDRSYSMIAPTWAQEDRRMMNNLQARGIPVGSDAFNETWSNTRRDRGDTIDRLAISADTAGGTEQNRQFSLAQQERATSLGELASIFGGSYQPALTTAMPNGAAPVNLIGPTMANAAARNQNALAGQQANAQGLSSLGSLAGMLGGAAIFSDRRLKSDAVRVGKTPGGVPVWMFRYNTDPKGVKRFGVMADEAPPEAVMRHPSGFDMVNYARIT